MHYKILIIWEYLEEELKIYGIDEKLKLYVKQLTYNTFRDFQDSEDNYTGMIQDNGDYRLNKWQEKHGELILDNVNELKELRYVLCPKIISESEFWKTYFSLISSFLPEENYSGEVNQTPKSHEKDINDCKMSNDQVII